MRSALSVCRADIAVEMIHHQCDVSGARRFTKKDIDCRAYIHPFFLRTHDHILDVKKENATHRKRRAVIESFPDTLRKSIDDCFLSDPRTADKQCIASAWSLQNEFYHGKRFTMVNQFDVIVLRTPTTRHIGGCVIEMNGVAVVPPACQRRFFAQRFPLPPRARLLRFLL